MEMPEQDRRSAEKAERAKGLHEAMEDAAASRLACAIITPLGSPVEPDV